MIHGSKLRKLSPYLYTLPALLLAFLFCYRPFFLTLVSSVSHVRPSGQIIRFVGLENYKRVFQSASFHDSMRATLLFTLLFVPVNFAATFLMALLCHGKSKALKAARISLMLIMAVAMSSIVLLFKTLFDEHAGLYNSLLGRSIPWFSEPKHAMAMLVYVGVYLDFGFDFLLFSASLLNIPRPLYEVADLEGASAWDRLRYLELPLTAPTSVFVLATSMKDAMLICSPVMILTEGGPFRSTQTLVYQMYLEGFKGGGIAQGSVLAVVAFSLTFLLFMGLMAVQKRRVFYQ